MCRNDVISHLATVDEMAQHASLMIPMQVLADIDNSRNPMQLTRERLERAATENQFMNGKIAAINVRIFRLMPLNIGATEVFFPVVPQVP